MEFRENGHGKVMELHFLVQVFHTVGKLETLFVIEQ